MYALLTRAPLTYQPKSICPFDLHVLGLPLAFILSQDQTLHSKFDLECLGSISQSSQLWDTHYLVYASIFQRTFVLFFLPRFFRFGSAKLILFFIPATFFEKKFQLSFFFFFDPLFERECKSITFFIPTNFFQKKFSILQLFSSNRSAA